MAEERRKGPPERRRSGKAPRVAEGNRASAGSPPDVDAAEQQRAQDPNDVARFDAEELDASIRAREKEDRGEVF
jgi:hypothetical protein